MEGAGLAAWLYARRRSAQEALLADAGLSAPFTLCPSMTDPATAREWLTWTSAGSEGLCFKRLSEPYRAGTNQGVGRVQGPRDHRGHRRRCCPDSAAVPRRAGPEAAFMRMAPHGRV
ncbi:hypothetical protein GCM10023323_22090 [Streptomyces thinghirensis]|uniref:ATP-dependent DNA ligase family profile domain-containing protein n=1 Tax=Streptomyces thinghirensis TaxID=551547 RepID=A0ABP9T2J2_9ACTN